MKKTRDEINDEVKALKEIQYSVPHYNLFGEDNWQAIAVQIDALDGYWSEQDAYYYFGNDKINESELDNALSVIAWRNGEYGELGFVNGELIDSPSRDWKQLVK